MNKKIILGQISGISGCIVTNNLSIEIETSDEIKLNEIIGKKVEVIIQ